MSAIGHVRLNDFKAVENERFYKRTVKVRMRLVRIQRVKHIVYKLSNKGFSQFRGCWVIPLCCVWCSSKRVFRRQGISFTNIPMAATSAGSLIIDVTERYIKNFIFVVRKTKKIFFVLETTVKFTGSLRERRIFFEPFLTKFLPHFRGYGIRSQIIHRLLPPRLGVEIVRKCLFS